MSVKDINYRAAVGKGNQTSLTRMRSPLIWADCPWFQLQTGSKDGFAYHDDLMDNYVQAANVAASASTLVGPWSAFSNATAGATVASGVSPAGACGTMILATNTVSEGVTAGLHQSKNISAYLDALSATNRVWWEARVKVSSITANHSGLALGLVQVGRLITLGQQASTSAIAAVDSVGFFRAATGTTALQTVIGNGTATVVNATAGVIAADTYTKLGFYWDGTTGTFYQDGAALTTTINSGTSGFPATDSLAFSWSILGGSSASSEIATMDWVAVAQERTANVAT